LKGDGVNVTHVQTNNVDGLPEMFTGMGVAMALMQQDQSRANAMLNTNVAVMNSYVRASTNGATVLTSTPAQVCPSLVLSNAGTWKITANSRFNYNGLTLSGPHTVTHKVRRINNTPADLADSVETWLTPAALTLANYTAFDVTSWSIYTTTATNDAVAVFCDVSGSVIAVGSLDSGRVKLEAIRLY